MSAAVPTRRDRASGEAAVASAVADTDRLRKAFALARVNGRAPIRILRAIAGDDADAAVRDGLLYQDFFGMCSLTAAGIDLLNGQDRRAPARPAPRPAAVPLVAPDAPLPPADPAPQPSALEARVLDLMKREPNRAWLALGLSMVLGEPSADVERALERLFARLKVWRRAPADPRGGSRWALMPSEGGPYRVNAADAARREPTRP